MNIRQKWDELRQKNEAGLIAYTMAGFPSLDESMRIAKTLAESGADFLEIGLPFSDPIADGPVIQAASNAGLANGATFDKLLNEVPKLKLEIPLILMSYLNPLLNHGLSRTFRDLKRAGFSGLIVPDLPADESGEWTALSKSSGVDLILLAAPTSPDARLKKIAEASSGFVYCVSVAGTTGIRKALPPEAPRMVRRLRKLTGKPLAVGFGVSTPEHVRELSKTADGVIVASRILKAVEEGEDFAALVRGLKQATHRDSPKPVRSGRIPESGGSGAVRIPFIRRTVHHRRIPASCTPVAAYKKLFAGGPHSFLYESLESTGKRGRYSFLGGKPYVVFKSFGTRIEIYTKDGVHHATGDPLQTLRQILNELRMDASVRPFSGGAVGYASYDAVRFFETLPDKNPDTLRIPEFYFIFPEEVLVFDHLEKTVDIVIHSDGPREERMLELSRLCQASEEVPGTAAEGSWQPDRDVDGFAAVMAPEAYMESVRRAKEYILAGDAFQIVLSQRFTFPVKTDPLRIYEALRVANPSPYMYYLDFGGLNVLGSSPEILVKVLDRQVTIRPLAGTRRRGKDEAEDQALEAELVRDEKERAEHVMLVDLARNDIGRVCDYGTVETTDLFTVERYSKVMHMVSNVQGTLRKDRNAFDCFAACFPAGTVSGAPKVRAMEIIDELEPVRRGIYAGSIGYFDFAGNMDMCIAIRTVVVQNGEGMIQAGAGIVADSDPEHEYHESLNKARALFQAVLKTGG
jgi:anthranilate synthase component 1